LIQPQICLSDSPSTQTLFPRGIDVVLVDDASIVAIPRTTRLES
jgi:alpha-D-ribose 1-methylphosphonate 5-triphosphate synthase subunit PhnH